MDYVDFASASQVIPALSRGDLDIGDTGINPAMFNAMARNLGLKLVADKGSQPPGFGFTALIVSPTVADQVKGPADLKGRKIAMTPPGLGTANGYVLAKYLASAQLTPNDVDIVPIAFPEQVAALTNHSVDVAIMAEPYATRATQEKIGVRLEGLDQMDPYQQVAGLVYTDKFVNEHHDLAVKWMTAYVKGIRAYDEAFTKGIGKDRIVQVLADKTDIKDKALWNEIVPAGLNPNGTLNTDSIKSAGEFFHSIGLVETVPPIDSYVDNSFTQAADQILGPAPNP